MIYNYIFINNNSGVIYVHEYVSTIYIIIIISTINFHIHNIKYIN